MNWERMMEEGRRVGRDPKFVRDSLRGLALDPRFPAVLALIESTREAYVAAGASQKLAAHKGSLEHCMGSVFALTELRDRVRGLVESGRKTGGATQGEEG